jgi:DNA-binding NarL/FixJ family response regulator
MADDLSEVRSVMSAGAGGYVLKDSAADDRVDAVRRVAEGGEPTPSNVWGASLLNIQGAYPYVSWSYGRCAAGCHRS